MKFNKIMLCALFLCSLSGLFAQQAATTSGGEASGSGGTTSYTIGQVSYSTLTGAGGILTEGVQQPYEIFVIIAVDKTDNIQLQLSAFPNPSTSLLHLRVEQLHQQNLSYQLFDVQGRLLSSQLIMESLTDIDMSNLLSGSYLLRVMEDTEAIKTFKIIKN